MAEIFLPALGNAPATSEAEVVQLRARVQWLSDFINHNLLATHHGEDIENVKTGSDLAELLGSQLGVNPANSANLQFKAQSQKAFITIPSSNLAQPQVRTGILSSTPAELTSSNHRSRGLNVQDKASSRTSPTNTGSADLAVGHVSYRNSAGTDQATEGFVVGHGRAPDAAARRFIDAYFRNVDRAYPFVNQAKILKNLETMGDLSFKTRSLLCSLYSLFNPTRTSTYSIVGIAARQAITIGLTRRAADDHAHSPAETELRHQLYWSVLTLDRMMAVSQSLPVALTDENADVPLPGLTVNEFASPERATYARKLQTSRHIIQLQQLESRILDQIHFRKKTEIAKLTPSDRRVTLSSLRASIKDWYSKGCLMSPMEAGNATAAQTVRQFAGLISGGIAAFFSENAVFPLAVAGVGNATVDGDNAAGGTGRDKESLLVLMKHCITELTSLMVEMLGRSTCFQFVEYPSDDDNQMGHSVAAADLPLYQKPQHRSQYQQHEAQQGPSISMSQITTNWCETNGTQELGGKGDEVTGYGWGPLDLEFL
ncbi:hypothetical protein LI328DRAFT_172126 [Trichoderma asperelloides]|nr:hypothetical protein LI328DRAFT_172126 [Trichoderma asperelloides]